MLPKELPTKELVIY